MLVLASVTQSLTDAVTSHGVWAIFVLMAIDALLPVGGELIMVVAGALAAGAVTGHPGLFGHPLSRGLETYLVLAVSGIAGSLLGAVIGWWIGRTAGRDAIDRWGRYVHLGPHQMLRAERWFARHGAAAVLLGRLTPLVRSFISVTAGVLRAPLAGYLALSALGSAIWCFGLAGVGWALGSRWDNVHHLFKYLDAAAILGVAVAAGYLLDARRRRRAAAVARP